MENLFIIDDYVDTFKFEDAELDGYYWRPFDAAPAIKPWLWRHPYLKFRGDFWDEDTPNVARAGYEMAKDAIKLLSPTAEILSLSSCFFNKYLPEHNVNSNIHRDTFNPDHWSVILFVRGDGPTRFYANRTEDSFVTEVEGIPGRIAIFPSGMWHRASLPNNADIRIVLAYQIEVKNVVESMNGVEPMCTCGLKPVTEICSGSCVNSDGYVYKEGL
jgi:hypothetical protein